MSKVHLAPPNQITGTGVKKYQSTAFEQKKENIAAGKKGMLYGAYFYNKNAAKRWVFITDSLTAGALATCLVPPLPVEAGNGVSVDERYGIPFTTGLSVALSSTDSTYTAASTDLDMIVEYAIDVTSPTSDA